MFMRTMRYPRAQGHRLAARVWTFETARSPATSSTMPKSEAYIKSQILDSANSVGEHARRADQPRYRDSWWVNWEIEYAVCWRKTIVGVYAQGATDADIPEALQAVW